MEIQGWILESFMVLNSVVIEAIKISKQQIPYN